MHRRRRSSSDLQNMCRKGKRGFLNRHVNLLPIEEEQEDSDSHAPSMT
jgi:hypothetical protein